MTSRRALAVILQTSLGILLALFIGLTAYLLAVVYSLAREVFVYALYAIGGGATVLLLVVVGVAIWIGLKGGLVEEGELEASSPAKNESSTTIHATESMLAAPVAVMIVDSTSGEMMPDGVNSVAIVPVGDP